MWRISAASVRRYPHLFIGMFVALAVGVGLIGVTARAIFAAVSAPPTSVGEAITLHSGDGATWTVHNTPDDLGPIITVLGLGATVSAFEAITVVAGAAALSVSLRRRDVGLLRMAGAGKGTVRRVVLAEALVVSIPATLVGSVLVAVTSHFAFDQLNRTSLSDVDITPGPLGLPLLVAVGSGLLITLLGALAGSSAATRTRPHAALQQATLDSAGMTVVRALTGVLLAAGGAVMVVLTFGMSNDSSTPVAIFGTIFLALGLIAFAPVVIPRLLRLGMLPLRLLDPIAGLLAATSVGAAKRRTSSLVAPVLGVLAVVGIFATVLATSMSGAREDLLARDAAQLVVTSKNGLTRTELSAVRSTSGVRAFAALTPARIALAGAGDVSVDDAAAVDLTALSSTDRFKLTEGSLKRLGPAEVAVSAEVAGWEGWHAGDQLTYALFGDRPSGQKRTARIAAILDAGQSLPPLILPPEAIKRPPATARVRLAEGASVRDAEQELGARLSGTGATVTAGTNSIAAERAQQDHVNWIALLILAAPASIYAIIGIASAGVMATSRRSDEVGAMRRLGISRRQVLRIAWWEAIGTTLVGVALAAALVTVGALAFRASVPVYGGSATLSVPWTLLASVAGGCLATNIVTSVLSTLRLLRNHHPRT